MFIPTRIVVLAALALGVLVSILDARSATAHAVLLRSTPASRQTLARAPTQVALLFSEPLDPVFSKVRVFDADNQVVDQNDARVDPNDDRQLVVSLQPGLPNGVYLVVWRSLSTIDVHPDKGLFQIYVGVPVAVGAALPSAGGTSTPETTFGRWWFYLAASLFGGVLASWKLVFSPVLVDTFADSRAAIRRRAHRLIVLGGALLIVGTLFTAVAQAAAAADLPLGSAFGQPLADLLLRGRFAAIWWPRLGLEVASLLLIAFGGLGGLAAECALATLPAVLLTSSLTSHGAALQAGPGPGILVDWLHILGATAWVGGLVSLVFLLPVAHRSALAGLVPVLLGRFGRFALSASAVVILSGTLQAALEVGRWSALIETTYGQLVLVKIALLGGMLSLAALNRWRGKSNTIRAELALGVVVLVVAAMLSGTPPDRGPLS
jgi:copper transport protein